MHVWTALLHAHDNIINYEQRMMGLDESTMSPHHDHGTRLLCPCVGSAVSVTCGFLRFQTRLSYNCQVLVLSSHCSQSNNKKLWCINSAQMIQVLAVFSQQQNRTVQNSSFSIKTLYSRLYFELVKKSLSLRWLFQLKLLNEVRKLIFAHTTAATAV